MLILNEEIEEFLEKREYLQSRFEQYSQKAFYRYIFPPGSFEKAGIEAEEKPNGILCRFINKRAKHRIIFDDLDELKYSQLSCSSCIMSPISYYGMRRSAKNARFLYALAYDFDGVMIDNFANIEKQIKNKFTPRPTFVCNSGHGLHYYYVLDKPIPLYTTNKKKLEKLKEDLTVTIWNKYTSTIEKCQKLSLFQGFRMPGTPTKLSNEIKVEAYKTGERISLSYLLSFSDLANEDRKVYYGDEPYFIPLTEHNLKVLEENCIPAPKKSLNERQITKKWKVNRNLYDWWLNKIKTDKDLKVGHRYFSICCLAAYAQKCSYKNKKKNPNPVTFEELKRDAYSLIPYMNQIGDDNDFTNYDVENALKFYRESFINFPIHTIETVSGLRIERNRRNYRKQDLHLKIARATRDAIHENWQNKEGRPKGSKDKKKRKSNKQRKVKAYKKKHPNTTKYRCAKDTGLDYKTVSKYW